MSHDISNVGVTPHFFTGQNLFQKILIKHKYWHKQLREAFFNRAKFNEKKYWEKINIDKINWQKPFDRSTKCNIT